jgi:MFS family permease
MATLAFDRHTSSRIRSTIFVSQSLFSASMILTFTLLPIIANDLSGSESLAGLPSTLITLARALIAYPMGVMMGHYGRRSGHTLGYFLGVIGSALGVLAITQESFWLLLAASMLLGSARAGADQTRFTAAEVYPELERASVIGWIVFAGTIGAIGGPLLVSPSNHLAESLGLDRHTGIWIVSGAMVFIGMIVTYLFMRPDPREISRQITNLEIAERMKLSDAASLDVPVRSLSEIFRLPQVRLAVAAMGIGQTVMVIVMTMTPLHMDHHDHGEGAISLVIMAHTLGMFGLSGVTGKFIDRWGRVNMILVGAVMLIAACIMAPLSTAMPVLVISLFLLGLGWNFCFVSGTSLLSDALTTDERGEAQGMSEMLSSGAAALGSFGSGVIFDLGSFFLVSMIGLALTLVLTGMIGRYVPRQQAPLEDASY